MSIKEIAEKAGVSAATVSRVLNNPNYKCSSPEVRDRIWKAAIALNYTPNTAARNLKMGIQNTEKKVYYIGVLMTRMEKATTDPFFNELLRVIESEIHKQIAILTKVWYMPLFSNDKKCRRENLDQIIDGMYEETDQKCDGLIIIGKCNKEALKKLNQKYKSVVSVNRNSTNYEVDEVLCDGQKVAMMAVEYLIHAGHRKVGALLKFDDGQGHLRYAGYLDTCRKAGIPAGDSGIVWLDTEGEQHLHDYRERILRNFKECTAVFCYNDKIAFQLEVLLKEEGIRVPEDISLISIDDSELAELAETRLTSVHHPTDKLGARAAENLLAIMKNRNFDGNYEFVTEIVERDSVRSLNRV